jgi:serine/threonine protein kinase
MPETIAGRYALLTNIGAGASADVWQARDTVLQRDVAIKRFAPGHSMDDTMARELGALSSLDHPGIVRLYDAGVEDERPYLVVELVEGPTLKERLSYGPAADGNSRRARSGGGAVGVLDRSPIPWRRSTTPKTPCGI